MASESKIGLLLCLAIIFAVAFVLNGLPRFANNGQSDDLTRVIDRNPIGIRPAVAREVFQDGLPMENVVSDTPQTPPASEDSERSRDSLPSVAASDETANDAAAPAEVFKLKPSKPAWPKVHIVKKGEHLADIAKKYYGPREGNRKANVMRIFESNRQVLKSPDKIYPGQKLVIPSLWASGLDAETIDRIFPASMFERVESIGKRHL